MGLRETRKWLLHVWCNGALKIEAFPRLLDARIPTGKRSRHGFENKCNPLVFSMNWGTELKS